MTIRELKILLVEDHDLQLRMQARLLTSMGVNRVDVAASGRVALATLRAPDCDVDIVISDLSMPDMDGIELLAEIARARPAISVILNSALAPALVECAAAIAQGYDLNLLGTIAKPLTSDKLLALFARHGAASLNE